MVADPSTPRRAVGEGTTRRRRQSASKNWGSETLISDHAGRECGHSRMEVARWSRLRDRYRIQDTG